jgi:hypothetical protein
MTTDQETQQPDENSQTRPGDAPQPPSNPNTDRESVQKGEEQLDKISGN